MSSLLSPSDLNKGAVEFVRSGNYQAAIFALDNALQFVNDHPTLVAKPHPDHQLLRSADSSLVLPVQMDVDKDENDHDVSRIQSFPIASHALRPASEDNLFDFYDRMLVLLDQGNFLAERVIILYNMAVTYHNEGLRRGGVHQTIFFEKALDLYNSAQMALYDSWSDIGDDDILLLLALALSNNVGHVHYYLHNFSDSRHSLEALKHFMSSLPGYDDDDEEEVCLPGCLSSEDYGFFNTTTVTFEGANFTVAPAA